jgi:hypothetical protein
MHNIVSDCENDALFCAPRFRIYRFTNNDQGMSEIDIKLHPSSRSISEFNIELQIFIAQFGRYSWDMTRRPHPNDEWFSSTDAIQTLNDHSSLEISISVTIINHFKKDLKLEGACSRQQLL